MSTLSFSGIARSMLPIRYRAALRGSTAFNWAAKVRYGGVRSVQHPKAPYTVYFDGVRNLGWSLGTCSAECEEMQFVADRVRQRAVNCAWDVGANIGSWALFLAGLTPKIDQIVCFEPDQTNRKFLEMNVSRNRIDRIRIEPIALSSHSGSGTFLADEMTGATGTLETNHSFITNWYGKKTSEVSVTLRTVDELIAEGMTPPDLMKIDVEGHEYSVLEGATETLRRHRPLLMMEVTTNLPKIDALLRDLGYDYFSAVTGRQIPNLQREMVALPAAA